MTAPAFKTGLETRDLTLSRGGRPVAKGVSFDLPPGTITVLRGANGSGKTTLLRTLAGLLPPATGTIDFTTGGDDEATAATRREKCVFFGHANAVKAPLTIAENLTFWIKLYGAGQSEIDQALNAFDLTNLADRRVETLSAGQRRRVGFCRVLIARKPIWLLDEPTASMDAVSIEQFQHAVLTHRDAGGAILIATHDPLAFDGAKILELTARSEAA